MVINMAAMLDKARVIHRLPSDYKLALVMGVSHNSLGSYRAGKTLPDARVISKLCELTGDDPALVLAQIEEQRATTDDARKLWHSIFERLQAGAAAAIFAVCFSVLGMASFPSDAQAKTDAFSRVQFLYIVECWICTLSAIHRRWALRAIFHVMDLSRLLQILAPFSRALHVHRTASTAAA